MQSPPHVAIVGGGLTGALCALVLRSRGVEATIFDAGKRRVGGRLAGGQQPDSGAQFLKATPGSQFASVVSMLQREQLIAPWTGRFGMLGSRSGGFLPAEVIRETPIGGMLKDQGPSSESSTDFCGFLASSGEPTYVGTPSNASICEGLCKAAGISTVSSRVSSMRHRDHGGWLLDVEGAEEGTQAFDALVVATHDASFAAEAVRAIRPSTSEDGEVLARVADDLQAQRDHRTEPAFTFSAIYSRGLSSAVPFDAAVVPGSPLVQMLVRDGSKAMRQGEAKANNGGSGERWTAVSTASFARELLRRAPARGESGESGAGGSAAAAASSMLSEEVGRLFKPYVGDVEARPLEASAKRWGAAFAAGTMGLDHDALGLEQWQLVVAGDYLREHPTPIEAAAASGLEAGERLATFLKLQPKKV